MLLTITGVLVVMGVWLDFMATAMTASANGPFSRRFCYCLHRVFEVGAKLLRSPRLRGASGPCLTLSLIVVWFILSWLGWSLIYLGTESAIVSSGTRMPALPAETIYYVGFTLTTLGTGDFVPTDTTWRLLTVITAFHGLALVTLAITYAIPVIQAVAQKRGLACQFALWGGNVEALLGHLQKDPDYKSLSDFLTAVSPQILMVAQQHLAYPILHYYHSPVTNASLPLQLAILDEALREVPDDAFQKQPELRVLVPNCTRAITEFLTTLTGVFVGPCSEEPPNRETVNTESSVAQRLKAEHSTIPLSERRKLLRALIEEDGWNWQQVCA